MIQERQFVKGSLLPAEGELMCVLAQGVTQLNSSQYVRAIFEGLRGADNSKDVRNSGSSSLPIRLDFYDPETPSSIPTRASSHPRTPYFQHVYPRNSMVIYGGQAGK